MKKSFTEISRRKKPSKIPENNSQGIIIRNNFVSEDKAPLHEPCSVHMSWGSLHVKEQQASINTIEEHMASAAGDLEQGAQYLDMGKYDIEKRRKFELRSSFRLTQ